MIRGNNVGWAEQSEAQQNQNVGLYFIQPNLPSAIKLSLLPPLQKGDRGGFIRKISPSPSFSKRGVKHQKPNLMAVRLEVVAQRGVALITVLLVLAIASVAVVSMSTARQAGIRRTDNQLLAAQRWELALALEQQASAVLAEDAKSNAFDGSDDGWNKRSLQSSAAGMTATANIEDLQGRINLNNLFRDGELSSDDVSRLRRLLTILELKPELLDAIIDWTDADMEIRYPHGAEDETYTRRKPPYRAANRPFADVSELLLVEGIDREIYDSLRPYIYVAEGYAPLNINIAEAGVLRCLADDISEDQAASMFRAGGKPFKKIEDFLKDEAVAELKIGKYGLSIGSEHFQLSGNIDATVSQFRFVSQLRRDDGQVAVVKRQRLGAADNG